MNPVVMLDEVDKLGNDWRGDPSSALLEVLDPAQNHTFRDHYLEVDLDLSDVLFIATANVVETIPGPLLDRMEVVRLDGYTEDEKVAIARDHLLARQLERNGLDADEVPCTDDALRVVVADYTREAGVRNLERELGKLLRKVATAISSGDSRRRRWPSTTPRRAHVARSAEVLLRGAGAHLGPRRGDGPGRHRRRRRRAVRRGHRHGRSGDGGLTLTGQLGDVMKESASIALSPTCARTRPSSASTRRRSTASASTCTCPRARCPRTVRRPASP